MQTSRRFFASLRRFHNDEDGLQALDTIMIVAVAALVLVVVLKFGKGQMFNSVKSKVMEVING